MSNPLSNLNLKWWHTVLLTSSFFIFSLSLVVELVAFDNATVSFASLGLFFISLGEGANQSFQESFHPRGTIRKDIRVVTLAGVALWIVGLIFEAIAIIRNL